MFFKQYSDVVSFFKSDVENIIKKSLIHVEENDHDHKEIKTMMKASKKMDEKLKIYMAHRLRAKVQFAAIDGMKNWVYEHPECRVMIVLDHKQKILNMRYREGQVEYFGKKGMSLLGTIIIEGVRNDPNAKWSYNFVDYIVKG